MLGLGKRSEQTVHLVAPGFVGEEVSGLRLPESLQRMHIGQHPMLLSVPPPVTFNAYSSRNVFITDKLLEFPDFSSEEEQKVVAAIVTNDDYDSAPRDENSDNEPIEIKPLYNLDDEQKPSPLPAPIEVIEICDDRDHCSLAEDDDDDGGDDHRDDAQKKKRQQRLFERRAQKAYLRYFASQQNNILDYEWPKKSRGRKSKSSTSTRPVRTGRCGAVPLTSPPLRKEALLSSADEEKFLLDAMVLGAKARSSPRSTTTVLSFALKGQSRPIDSDLAMIPSLRDPLRPKPLKLSTLEFYADLVAKAATDRWRMTQKSALENNDDRKLLPVDWLIDNKEKLLQHAKTLTAHEPPSQCRLLAALVTLPELRSLLRNLKTQDPRGLTFGEFQLIDRYVAALVAANPSSIIVKV